MKLSRHQEMVTDLLQNVLKVTHHRWHRLHCHHCRCFLRRCHRCHSSRPNYCLLRWHCCRCCHHRRPRHHQQQRCYLIKTRPCVRPCVLDETSQVCIAAAYKERARSDRSHQYGKKQQSRHQQEYLHACEGLIGVKQQHRHKCGKDQALARITLCTYA